MQVTDPGFGMRITRHNTVYSRRALGSQKSWFAMFEVFNTLSWVTVGITYGFLTVIVVSFCQNFSISTLGWSFITIGKTYFGNPFDTEKLNKNLKNSKYFIIFSITIMGTMIYWHFTGLLISLLAVPSATFPLKSLNELSSKQKFKLISGKSWSAASTLLEWSGNNAKTKSAYENFVVPNYFITLKELQGAAQRISQEKDPNQALLLSLTDFIDGTVIQSTTTLRND